MSPPDQELYLQRRLTKWQIFFIALGGIIGIGFFRESSISLAIAGPVGALIAVVVVGVVATSVMECICEFIVLWPIPNAMVEYVKTFLDEDLGVAVGIMYWYTYCVTLSALIIAVADLTDYWGISDIFKALIFVLVPVALMVINSLPVQVFGWIEFLGGIVKLVLVCGTIILAFLVNAGVSPEGRKIGPTYFVDGVTYNNEVAAAPYQAVFEAIPLATFAYLGVELLTTTAFEAFEPNELRLPAANIGWFSTVLYSLATGSFVANVSWQDQNLPDLFQQALTTITDPEAAKQFAMFPDSAPHMNASPLIALYRVGYRFLPSFLNACFIYSALSCANTGLYVASRQMYGMTRTITIDYNSGIIRRGLHWLSTVNHKTRTPRLAVVISGLLLSWLPFIRLKDERDEYLSNIQSVLIAIGSVSCIMMWFCQCIAYILFFHWRDYHRAALQDASPRWDKLFDRRKAGHFRDFQPFLGYLGAVFTLMIMLFFGTVALWNGKYIPVKAVSAFVSPVLVVLIWIVKKAMRRDGRRFKFFENLSDYGKFESKLQDLEDLIYPIGHLDTSSSRSEMNRNPDYGPAIQLLPRAKDSTLERHQDIVRSDSDSENDRLQSFGHTNLALVPNRHDFGKAFATRQSMESNIAISELNKDDETQAALYDRQ